MDQGEELRKNGTKLRQMMEAEIDEVDIKFLNITDIVITNRFNFLILNRILLSTLFIHI